MMSATTRSPHAHARPVLVVSDRKRTATARGQLPRSGAAGRDVGDEMHVE